MQVAAFKAANVANVGSFENEILATGLDLPTAIHRMAGMPATKFQLAGRGAIREGAFADLVVFDPARIRDTATYDKPHQYATGMRFVFVNGKLTISEGRYTGVRAGLVLRHREKE